MNSIIAQLSKIEGANRLIKEDGVKKKNVMKSEQLNRRKEIDAKYLKQEEQELAVYSEQIKEGFSRKYEELKIDSDMAVKKLRHNFSIHKDEMVQAVLKSITGDNYGQSS